MKVSKFTNNRIIEIDALRGFALFGILFVNIFVFHAPYCYYSDFYGVFEGLQAITVDFVVNFAGGKFLFIFAFLFGYGIVLQHNSNPNYFLSRFVKRMAVLFFFGNLHIVFFWFGDILASYALLGLLVLLTLKLSNKNILVLASLFIFFRPLYYLGVVFFRWPMVNPVIPADLNEFLHVFQLGSYLEILKLRMLEFIAFIPENLVWYISKTYGVFLIGIYAARINLYDLMKSRKAKFTKITLLLIIISIVWINFKMEFFKLFNLNAEPFWRPILIAINVVFETTLAIGYILGLSLIFQKSKWLTKVLAKTGRLALTNYILQSLICVFIFYGFGLGWYGKLKPTDLVIISIVIFAFNVIFSSIYLKFKPIGPLEYLWRKLI